MLCFLFFADCYPILQLVCQRPLFFKWGLQQQAVWWQHQLWSKLVFFLKKCWFSCVDTISYKWRVAIMIKERPAIFSWLLLSELCCEKFFGMLCYFLNPITKQDLFSLIKAVFLTEVLVAGQTDLWLHCMATSRGITMFFALLHFF